MPCHLVPESPPVVPSLSDAKSCLRSGRIIDSVGGDEPSSEMYWYFVYQICLSESLIPLSSQVLSGKKNIDRCVHVWCDYMLVHICMEEPGNSKSLTLTT